MLDITIHATDLVEHEPDEPGINLLCTMRIKPRIVIIPILVFVSVLLLLPLIYLHIELLCGHAFVLIVV